MCHIQLQAPTASPRTAGRAQTQFTQRPLGMRRRPCFRRRGPTVVQRLTHGPHPQAPTRCRHSAVAGSTLSNASQTTRETSNRTLPTLRRRPRLPRLPRSSRHRDRSLNRWRRSSRTPTSFPESLRETGSDSAEVTIEEVPAEGASDGRGSSWTLEPFEVDDDPDDEGLATERGPRGRDDLGAPQAGSGARSGRASSRECGVPPVRLALHGAGRKGEVGMHSVL